MRWFLTSVVGCWGVWSTGLERWWIRVAWLSMGLLKTLGILLLLGWQLWKAQLLFQEAE